MGIVGIKLGRVYKTRGCWGLHLGGSTLFPPRPGGLTFTALQAFHSNLTRTSLHCIVYSGTAGRGPCIFYPHALLL